MIIITQIHANIFKTGIIILEIKTFRILGFGILAIFLWCIMQGLWFLEYSNRNGYRNKIMAVVLSIVLQILTFKFIQT